MAVMLPKSNIHRQKESDHVDAWLMSYADMITLLFLFFVIFVSVLYSRQTAPADVVRSEPGFPHTPTHGGTLSLDTPFESLYRTVTGIIAADNADTQISVEKSTEALHVDMSALLFFEYDSAEMHDDQKALLGTIAKALKDGMADSVVTVEGYTDDGVPVGSKYANNWELSAMRAAKVATVLIGQGVDPARVRAVSYAGNYPVVPNTDAGGNPISENRIRNQRVVIKLEAAGK